jgi:hypothetical protein
MSIFFYSKQIIGNQELQECFLVLLIAETKQLILQSTMNYSVLMQK